MTAPGHLSVLLTSKEIESKVLELAKEINRDYQAKCPILVGVLKGCFVFMADLVRVLDIPVEVDFAIVSSYGAGMMSAGKVSVVQEPRCQIENRDVLVIEDIIDTGLTVNVFLDYLRSRNPSSVKLCALFDKPSRREVPVSIDYLGFTVPNVFVVGYGLDFNEKYRHLPDLCILEDRQ
ncbi:MAG: hypoxanthine phosphoribosyltransferase [Chloroflexota bacterium]